MGVWRLVYDKNVLKRLWAAGKTHVEIAAALGCSAGYVEKLRKRHGLPRRPRCHHGPQEDDPTPEQIKERAAECIARREPPAVPKTERVIAPKYSWDGFRFTALS
jgi:hypothetical protein